MTRAHWNERYRASEPDTVSWYESTPSVSLEMFTAVGAAPECSVVDIGGGESRLVDHLLADGYRDVTVLDISPVALATSRRRLGDRAGQVSWIDGDIRTLSPTRRWDLWHDRAVFHFMVDPVDRANYLRQLAAGLAPRGAVVLGTFATDGPTTCSGLPVARYDPDELAGLLADAGPFDVVATRRHVHTTPSGMTQPFSWLAARASR